MGMIQQTFCYQRECLALTQISKLNSQHVRNYTQYKPIPDITFKTVQGSEDKNGLPLVILHGLFGSYLNFSTFARQFSQQHHRPVHLVNLRNHSDPQNHSPVMNFTVMASDLALFLDKHKIEECDLFGFSLGGKTVSLFRDLHYR